MSKTKKLFWTKKAQVFDFLQGNFPIRNKDLYLKFPDICLSSLRNYKALFGRLNTMDGLTVGKIKILINIMNKKMTPTTHLNKKELECIEYIGKWLDERLK